MNEQNWAVWSDIDQISPISLSLKLINFNFTEIDQILAPSNLPSPPPFHSLPPPLKKWSCTTKFCWCRHYQCLCMPCKDTWICTIHTVGQNLNMLLINLILPILPIDLEIFMLILSRQPPKTKAGRTAVWDLCTVLPSCRYQLWLL